MVSNRDYVRFRPPDDYSDTDSAAASIHTVFEDGTLNYQAIAGEWGVCNVHIYDLCGCIALRHGFAALRRLGGMEAISSRVQELYRYLRKEMGSLRHGNGVPLVLFYGSPEDGTDLKPHGPTIAFNIMDPEGGAVGYNRVNQAAMQRGIILRVGCFCNIGACQAYLNLTADEVVSNYLSGRSCWVEETAGGTGQGLDVINAKPTGCVRASLGMYSTPGDCEGFLRFLRECFLDLAPTASATFPTTISTPADSNVAIGGRSNPPLPMSAVEPLQPIQPGPVQPAVSLEQIFVYPIKSCGGMEVSEWVLGSHGLAYDREFVLAHAQEDSGAYRPVLTQKAYPRMVLIKPMIAYSEVYSHLSRPTDTPSSGVSCPIMRVTAPDMPVLNIPLEEADSQAGITQPIRVCGRKCSGYISTQREANELFSHFLGVPCCLIRNHSHRLGPGPGMGSGAEQEEAAPSVSYANDAPFLLLSRESVLGLLQVCGVYSD